MPQDDLSKLSITKGPATRSSRRRRPLFIIGVIIAAALILAFFARKVLFPAVAVEATTVARVYPSQSFTILNASGYVVAQRKAAVASKTTGRLISIAVEEGNRIRKGDVIAELEHADAEAARDRAAANLRMAGANVEQARAELADAEANFRRSRELLAKDFISRLEFDTTEARYRKAQAGVSSAEASAKAGAAALREASVALDYAFIRAPFDAVVLTKNADIGDIITPLGAAANAKAAVVTIADMGSLQVEVDVSESNIGKVQVKQPCEIQLDALPDSRFRGEVHMIVPTADRTKATVLVKVRFTDPVSGILPEMSAKVAFLERQLTGDDLRPRTAVAPASLRERNGRTSAFVIRDGRLAEVTVTTGERIGDMVEVLSGLSAGDRIVLRPSSGLRHGMKITVAEK